MKRFDGVYIMPNVVGSLPRVFFVFEMRSYCVRGYLYSLDFARWVFATIWVGDSSIICIKFAEKQMTSRWYLNHRGHEEILLTYRR